MESRVIDTYPAASGEFVQGLARGLAVLRAFDAEHQRMRLTDLAARVGLTRATVRRLLLTLETLGYVRASDGQYELTARVLEVGHAYLSGQNLAGISRPYLEDLADDLGESTSITILSGTEILYVARIHKRNVIRIDITVGSRFPAVATSMGRVLIAAKSPDEYVEFMRHATLAPLTNRTIVDPDEFRREIDRVREQGWSLVDQEFDLGLRSIAVPVRDESGHVLAAINVSLRAVNAEPPANETIAQHVAALRRTAAEIARAIGLAAR
jgi:IclR family pca regulon transcriptional regulator